MSRASRSWRWRKVVSWAFAVILVWQIVSHSFAAYLASVLPKAALWLNPEQPAALLNLADRALSSPVGLSIGAPDQGAKGLEEAPGGMKNVLARKANAYERLNQSFSAFEILGQGRSIDRPLLPTNAPMIRAWTEASLLKEPLSARALKVLGQLAEAGNNDTDAAKFRHVAADLSLHQSDTIFWLLQKNAQTRNYESAISYADVLLRASPDSAADVVPILAYIAADPKGAEILKTVLARNPPWRTQFFAVLPPNVTDERIPLELLSALQTSPSPPTTNEVRSYVNFLIGRKRYDLAYYVWLQFLPAKELRRAGLLFNGGFAAKPSGLPFDWSISSGSGVTVDIVPKPGSDGEHALLIDFEIGRVDYHSVSQLVMLASGTYEFKGAYKGKLVGPRGLKWRIECTGGTIARVGESEMIIGITPGWKNTAFTFTIPTRDCPAQYVRLDLDARMVSEQLVSGAMFFSDLQITRVVDVLATRDQ